MSTFQRLTTLFKSKHYDLSLNLNREDRTFSGVVAISGEQLNNEAIVLHSKQLTIESATVDGKSATWSHRDNDELHINYDNPEAKDHVVTISFNGKITDAMHGLYPCYYEVDGEKKELLATQFESHHAREVFPSVDEPAGKATYDLTLTTEIGLTVLGNMPIEFQREENGKLVTKFETSPIMSSYLLAFVVGDLVKLSSKTKSGVEVNAWATPAQPTKRLEHALSIATRTIDFYEEYFDTPYPLPKSDHVALPDFSSGAMENWGLITYREAALLADEDTSISSKKYIATVIAHELAHMWFGNLVTMDWWDNLWLNESFATLMEYIAIDGIEPEWGIWKEFSISESIASLRRDAIAGVQSVQIPVKHPDEIGTLFDGAIVYAKGARLLRMMREYVGEEGFRTGLKNYFDKHKYSNTIGQNLWDALSETSGKDVGAFMEPWLNQSGYPLVKIEDEGDKATLSQKQFFIGERDDQGRQWPVPLLTDTEGLPELLTEESMTVETDKVFKLNNHDAAHYITRYPTRFREEILNQISDMGAGEVGRLQFLHEELLLALGQEITLDEVIPVLSHYKQETSDTVWSIIGMTVRELRRVIDNDEDSLAKLKSFVKDLAKTQYDRLGWERKEGESEGDSELRGIIASLMIFSDDEEAIESAHKIYTSTDLNKIDPEIRSTVIANEVKNFYSEELLSSLLKTYSKEIHSDIRDDLVAGITSIKTDEAASVILSKFTDNSVIRPQDLYRWFVNMARNRHARDLTWQWLTGNWSWIDEKFRSDKSLHIFPQYAAGALNTEEQLEKYKDFFMPMIEQPALNRAIKMGVTEIEGRIKYMKLNGPLVRKKLEEL